MISKSRASNILQPKFRATLISKVKLDSLAELLHVQIDDNLAVEMS